MLTIGQTYGLYLTLLRRISMELEYMTIGKFAQLMKVSIHQIRYFEKKEILTPAKIDGNGYHLYGEKEMYQLANILLFRSLNISVKKIKQHQQDNSTKGIRKSLLFTLGKVEEELLALEETRNKIKTVLAIQEDFEKDSYVTFKHKRYLKKLVNMTVENNSVNDLIEFFKKTDVPLFKHNFFYLITNNGEESVFIENANNYDYALEAGDYLIKNVLVTDQKELEDALEQFKKDFLIKTLQPVHIIIQEHSYHSIYYPNGIFYSLEAKLNKEM